MLALPFFQRVAHSFSPCSRLDPPLFCQGEALARLGSFPSHNLVIWTNGSVSFLFWLKAAQSLWTTKLPKV